MAHFTESKTIFTGSKNPFFTGNKNNKLQTTFADKNAKSQKKPGKTSPRNAPGCGEPSAAPGSIKRGAETRSGTVQSLKCCPCQQKRAARLPSAGAGSIKGGGPRNALGYRPEPEVLPLPAETSREAPKCCAWQHQGRGGPRNALGHRPEPEVLPLPAETSREAPKCCAWQHQRGAPKRARVPSVLRLAASRGAPKRCPCQQKRAARLPSAAPGSIKGGGPETRSGTVQSLKCLVRLPLGHRERRAP